MTYRINKKNLDLTSIYTNEDEDADSFLENTPRTRKQRSDPPSRPSEDTRSELREEIPSEFNNDPALDPTDLEVPMDVDQPQEEVTPEELEAIETKRMMKLVEITRYLVRVPHLLVGYKQKTMEEYAAMSLESLENEIKNIEIYTGANIGGGSFRLLHNQAWSLIELVGLKAKAKISGIGQKMQLETKETDFLKYMGTLVDLIEIKRGPQHTDPLFLYVMMSIGILVNEHKKNTMKEDAENKYGPVLQEAKKKVPLDFQNEADALLEDP